MAELYQVTSNGGLVDLEIDFENPGINIEGVEGILFKPLKKVEDKVFEDDKVEDIQPILDSDFDTGGLQEMAEEDALLAFKHECGVCADNPCARGGRGLILNGMSDSLFDIYQNVDTFKELWDTLEAKYMAEDASSKKFLVSCIIDKLPPSWKDFKHTLKHLKEELTLIELGSHLRIEESLRVQENDKPKSNNVAGPSVVNMVKHTNSSRYNDNKGKWKHHDTRANLNKKPKVTCWKCGKPGHLKKNYKAGHVYFKRMQDMSKEGLILEIDMDTEKYKTCMLTKITKKPFQNVKRKTKVLELIHSDLCDLHATPSLGNKKYFVTFIDDASRFCYVYLLHSKDKALDKLKVFKTKVELQQESLIKRLGTDRGGEYMDTLYFQSVGIIYETTALYTLQQNGISERKNRVLEEMVNSMLSYSGLSQGVWGEAMFYVIEPNDSVAINSIIESRDAIFDEHMFSSVLRPSQRSLMDVKTTFLNEDLEEEAPKQWHQKFDEVVLSNGYLLNKVDKFQVDLTTKFLSSKFYVKDMGEADVILVSTPLDTCEKLMPNRCLVVSQLEYSRVIGCLMYVISCIRPDIAFAVGKLTAGKEAEWLKNFLLEIPLWVKPIAPISIRCDSVATLAKAYSQM
nr:zinc finger, CCHC-type [Tanacetum cinerariifolium]